MTIQRAPRYQREHTSLRFGFPLAAWLAVISSSLAMTGCFSLDFGKPSPPTLAESLQGAASSAATPAGNFLKTGKSGELNRSMKWTNPKGGEVPIAISWSKNSDGVLVTASPEGKIPKGEDGTPRSQQVLKNGMLGFPLDYFKEQSKRDQSGFLGDMMSLWDLLFDRVIEGSAPPIIDYAKKRNGRLPSSGEASSLLAKAKKVFEIEFPDDSSKKPKVFRFEIEKYTYRAGTDGMFSIAYSWSCPDPYSSSPNAGPVKGTFTIGYTTSGLIGMDEKNNPFEDVFHEFDVAEKKRDEQAAKDAKKKSASGKSSGS